MSKIQKLILKILRGKSDANISFDDLRNLLLYLGFQERVRGSHHIFVKELVEELINLQCDGNAVKPYQVKQVRRILLKYGMGGED